MSSSLHTLLVALTAGSDTNLNTIRHHYLPPSIFCPSCSYVRLSFCILYYTLSPSLCCMCHMDVVRSSALYPYVCRCSVTRSFMTWAGPPCEYFVCEIEICSTSNPTAGCLIFPVRRLWPTSRLIMQLVPCGPQLRLAKVILYLSSDDGQLNAQCA